MNVYVRYGMDADHPRDVIVSVHATLESAKATVPYARWAGNDGPPQWWSNVDIDTPRAFIEEHEVIE